MQWRRPLIGGQVAGDHPGLQVFEIDPIPLSLAHSQPARVGVAPVMTACRRGLLGVARSRAMRCVDPALSNTYLNLRDFWPTTCRLSQRRGFLVGSPRFVPCPIDRYGSRSFPRSRRIND